MELNIQQRKWLKSYRTAVGKATTALKARDAVQTALDACNAEVRGWQALLESVGISLTDDLKAIGEKPKPAAPPTRPVKPPTPDLKHRARVYSKV